MALQKTLLKSASRTGTPPPKTYFCAKTIGSRELIFWTISIKKCMNNLDFFQPNLRRSSGSHCPVWRGMTHNIRLLYLQKDHTPSSTEVGARGEQGYPVTPMQDSGHPSGLGKLLFHTTSNGR